MPKRQKWMIILACGIFAIGLTWALMAKREPEPSYQGRTLFEWVEQSKQPSLGNNTQEADKAVRTIGTNAIPTSLKWISYESSPLRRRFIQLLRRMGVYPRFVYYPEHRADNAELVFYLLGSEGRAAIPELVRLVLTSSDYHRADRCINSIGYLGTDAVPGLFSLVSSSDSPPRTRAVAITKLAKFDSEAHAFVPVLAECLHDPNRGVAVTTLETLGKLHAARSIAFPVLTNALHSPSAELRRQAIISILSLKSPAGEAVPVLLPMLKDAEPTVRVTASNTLFKIAPEVFDSPLAN